MLSSSTLSIVAANLAPLFGAFFLGWSAFSLLLLYWAEIGVLGIVNLARILCTRAPHVRHWGVRLFFLVSFALLYSLWWVALGGALYVLMAPDILLENMLAVPQILAEIRRHDIEWGIAALGVGHAVSFLTTDVRDGAMHRLRRNELLWRPYMRIYVFIFALIYGWGLFLQFGSPIYGLVPLIFLKTLHDAVQDVRDRRASAAA